MAGKKKVAGPHALSIAGEQSETPKMEAKESKAFQAAEKRMGIEGQYGKAKKAKKTSRGK